MIGNNILLRGDRNLPRCTHWASPTGLQANSGTSIESPFRPQDFWQVSSIAGKTLCLMDGTYQGAAFMIAPPLQGATAGLSGTSNNRITIRALHDGGATIDGQHTRQPVRFTNNNFFTLQGFNAKHAADLVGDPGKVIWNNASNNIFRRLVLWDSSIYRNNIVASVGQANNLWEDVAVFGTGRKIFGFGGNLNQTNVARRMWLRWDGSIAGGPITSTMYYDTFGCRAENILFTWSGEALPEEYNIGGVVTGARVTNFGLSTPSPGIGATLGHDRIASAGTSPVAYCADAEVSSAFCYLKAGARYGRRNDGTPMTMTGLTDAAQANCITWRHIYSFIDQSHVDADFWRGINLGGLRGPNASIDPQSGPLLNCTASNLSSVRHNSFPDAVSTGWVVTGHSQGNDINDFPSAWEATSTGANLCLRWENQEVTTEPLWPWPMNQRIKVATAAAGAYSGLCPTCSSDRPVRATVDVTSDVEDMLGTIPASCRKPGGSS